jgi:ABC-type phosphate transport system substrate-binding protein
MISGVSLAINSIGYAGLDMTFKYGVLNQNSSCRLKIAQIINKAGKVVEPSIASAQAALRSNAAHMLSSNSCPGFGLCGNLVDGEDEDVWPLTALTVGALDLIPRLIEKFLFPQLELWLKIQRLDLNFLKELTNFQL